LPTITLQAEVGYSQPIMLPAITHMHDAALNVMIDFKLIKPELIGPDESVDQALYMAQHFIYHVLLVVDKEQQLLGVINSEDLLGEKPLKAIQERGVARDDISVRMVMTPREDIVAFNIENLRHAKVGHIITTLHARKQHYALVVKMDHVHQRQIVRGVFSLALLSKQLGIDVTSDIPEALSIAELHHDVHLHD